MRQLKFLAALFCAGALLSLPAAADEASVKKAVEDKINGKVQSVTKSGYLGLYEVFADGQVLYTDEKVSVLLIGTLVDGKTMQNVTAERLKKLTAVKFSELPLELAVKQVKGNGKRVLVTFEDPNCGYCRELTRRLGEIGNVTVHTFVVTFLGDDSRAKADAVWCAGARSAAWHKVMARQAVPPAAAGCRAPSAQTMKLAGMLGINLTPTVFFADGSRMNGIKPQAEIEERLHSAAAK